MAFLNKGRGIISQPFIALDHSKNYTYLKQLKSKLHKLQNNSVQIKPSFPHLFLQGLALTFTNEQSQML